MAALTLRTASSGIRPGFEHPVTAKRRALTTPPESGFVQRRQVNERRLDRTRLEWPFATEGQRYLLLKAWSDSKGGVLPMNYTPVDKTDVDAVEVVFVPGSREIVQTGQRSWRMSVEVEEVHA